MQSWHFILVSLWKSSHSNSLTRALLKEIKFYSVKLCLDFAQLRHFQRRLSFTVWSYALIWAHLVHSVVFFCLWSQSLVCCHLFLLAQKFYIVKLRLDVGTSCSYNGFLCLWSQSWDCCHLFLLVHRHSFHLCHCSVWFHFQPLNNHALHILTAKNTHWQHVLERKNLVGYGQNSHQWMLPFWNTLTFRNWRVGITSAHLTEAYRWVCKLCICITVKRLLRFCGLDNF